MLSADLLDLTRQKALITAVLPLLDILGDFHAVFQLSALRVSEEQLIGVLGASAWGNVNFCEVLWVDDFSRADDNMAGAGNLRHADLCKRNVGAASVTAVDGPLSLSWGCVRWLSGECLDQEQSLIQGPEGLMEGFCALPCLIKKTLGVPESLSMMT